MQEIQVHKLGTYPIVKHYIEELGIADLFDQHLKDAKPIHSASLCVLITNIIVSVRPLYKISNWLGAYSDGQSEFGYEASAFNDDRLGESLDILYKSDRHCLLSEVSIKAIKQHDLQTEELHNDTTTVSLSGAYDRNIKPGGVTPLRGYNKDGRPDAKQIVFGLTTTSDGHVPIFAQWYDGNISDTDTHQPNWNALRNLLQKTDFIYVADSKVATKENLGHIAGNKGFFISILPATRAEVKDFKSLVLSGAETPVWEEIQRYPNSRKKSEEVVYETCEAKSTQEGYLLHWIRSSTKAKQDAQKRQDRITKIQENLTTTQSKLNTYYLKTPEQIQARIDKIVAADKDIFEVHIKEITNTIQVKIGKGRIGKNTQFKQQTSTTYELEWTQNTAVIEAKSRLDGIFPLVTNTELPAKEVLSKYKNQPYLEKRFYTLKSIIEIAPVYLKLPHRIEAMLFLYFIALMIIALIERAIRKNMKEQQVEQLPILPQKMNTKKPTWNNIRYFFDQVFFIALKNKKQVQSIIVKGISKLHQKILDLLNIPWEVYEIKTLEWWKFKPV